MANLGYGTYFLPELARNASLGLITYSRSRTTVADSPRGSGFSEKVVLRLLNSDMQSSAQNDDGMAGGGGM